MARFKVDPIGREAYRAGLAGFLGELNRAEKDGKFHETANFSSVLKYALTNFGLAASDLARDEHISKGAISKWMHGLAMPSPPTRKTVVAWIRRKSMEQLDALGN